MASNDSSDDSRRSPTLSRKRTRERSRSSSPALPDDPVLQIAASVSGEQGDGELDAPRGKRLKEGGRGSTEFTVPKAQGRWFRKVLCDGLGKEKFKGMAESYIPLFDKSFPLDSLAPPTMYDAIYQRLSTLKGSKAGKSSIDPNQRELFKVQQKILEAAKPLLFLATHSGASEQQRWAVSTALNLVGDAFHAVTAARRQSILQQTSFLVYA